MYEILFYVDRNGDSPVFDYMRELKGRKDKDSRIKLDKLHEYIGVLEAYGTSAGEPYVKHLDGEIWELRPARERVLFVAWLGGKFVLLHHFVKKTQKTPKREIEKAKREFADFVERS